MDFNSKFFYMIAITLLLVGFIGISAKSVDFGNVEEAIVDLKGNVYTIGHRPCEPKYQKSNGGWVFIKYRMIEIKVDIPGHGLVSQWYIQNLENGNLTRMK